MPDFADIARLSPLPIVNLRSISVPGTGLLVETPSQCIKNFAKNEVCRLHYQQLAKQSERENIVVQCPYGFATLAVRTKFLHIAFSGVIPYPRLGGSRERQLAKNPTHVRLPKASFETAQKALINVESGLEALEKQQIESQSVALHEIRKLNRNVKQTAERLCREKSPDDPDQADALLVTIWKSADLMSLQFDVVELLANENLAKLPLKTKTNLYQLFDKCAKDIQTRSASRADRIELRLMTFQPKLLHATRLFTLFQRC